MEETQVLRKKNSIPTSPFILVVVHNQNENENLPYLAL